MSGTRHLYLVDDEPVPARIVKTSLERAGFQTSVFRNGLEALEALREAVKSNSLPDGLITDIEMPVMTGEELCKALEAEQPERSFPIFVVTSVPDQIHREWTARMDNLHFVEKPVSIKQLTSALEQALPRNGA
ncbi:MAG: response regulator [Pseudomonadaceae bacterium]|nr:response regulator [Pseudomonadaceae bacterium]